MNKSIVPKIRFKGFNDFYYKTTFNKFYNKGKSGGTPSTKNKDFYNGEILFLSIKDGTNQGKYIFQTEKTITKKGLKNSSAWLVPQNLHFVIEVQQINFERSWFIIEKKHYFILRSLVTKYGKDIVINTVNKIVINNVKENE
ncbi:hypothetical protein M1771_04700 [Spiroplasma citri]|uniref:hypothetical protein n=1 Tax=Spiroplasma citri TaxID=2133 RepID=UPI002412D57C|nr:hypothetical protein [Spiroplasma citri]WFH01198.1 hypothetical protein M1771_04700 [Spiroplasma citri]